MTDNDTQGLYHQQQLEQQEYEEWLADEDAQAEYQQYLDNKWSSITLNDGIIKEKQNGFDCNR